MTYVYEAERIDYDDYWTIGIFSTREKAEACIAKARAVKPRHGYQITRVEIDAMYDEKTWQVGDVIMSIKA
jgi:hypothetical protein